MEDIRWIHKLKEMGFSLKEIQKILSIRRTSNWVEPQEIADYLVLLDGKKKELTEHIDEIHMEIERIEQEYERVSHISALDRRLIGVPLRALEYLRCPFCGSFFSVEQAQMNSRYIYNGRLFCSCSYELEIRDGIVLTPDAHKEASHEADLSRRKYKDLPSTVITAMQRTYNFLLHRLLALPLKDSVIMETDINEFFYLYTHFRKIENRALFIVTDRFSQVLSMYKERIEYMKLDLDIVYLACASENYPLKLGCIDLRIDYFSANFRQHEEKGQDKLSRFIKPGGEVIGCYFSGASEKSSYSYEKYRCLMEENGYELLKERGIPCPEEIGGKNMLCLYEMRDCVSDLF